MFLFLNIFLVLLKLIDCNEFDSIVFQDLYHKFRAQGKDETELESMNKLFEINERIVSFDYEFKIHSNESDFRPKLIEEVLTKFITNNVKSILKIIDIRDVLNGAAKGVSSNVSCLACHSLINLLFNKFIPVKVLLDVIIAFCGALNIPNVSTNVCKGYLQMFKPHLEYIRHKTHLKLWQICGILLGVQCSINTGTCFKNPKPESENLCWRLKIPQNGSKPIHKNNGEIYKILHLTDIHVDPLYVPNSDYNCGQPYCCRADMVHNSSAQQSPGAGYWGSYYCDPPIHSVENLFENIDWESIDLVYWTGDVSSHESWADTWNATKRDSRIITALLKKYSKSLVVSAIGNHLAIPVGTYAPQEIDNELSAQYVYKELAEEWSEWLDSEAMTTFLRSGYYALKVRPGFRVIVVNTNYCARLNIWTLYQSVDPSDQLKWLITQLSAAEESGDFVHIVGHIPPDNRECTQSWLYNYLEITERYSHIIVGQFYGHTHRDEFRVLHSNSDCNITIGFVILSPSSTPYDDVLKFNPAYRLISTDEQGQVIDMETYTYDLTLANADNGSRPEWGFEYSMTKDYLIAINNYDLDQFYKTLNRDSYYLQLFYSHYTRVSPQQTDDFCDNDCKTIIINDLNVCNPFDSPPKSIITVG